MLKEKTKDKLTENYLVILDKEIVNEFAASLGAAFFRYLQNNNITDENHPVAIIERDIARIQNKVYNYTPVEVAEAMGVLKYFKDYIERLSNV